jgi:hypothetical protein
LPQGFDYLLLPRDALAEHAMEFVRHHLVHAAQRAVARGVEANHRAVETGS